MNTINTKKLFALFLVVLVIAFSFAACGEDTSDPDVQIYKVAMEPTFPPFNTINDETKELDGFDYDFMNAIAEDQGFQLEWVNMGFDNLVASLEAGNIDNIASGMDASADRKEQVDFSTTYYNTGLVLAVKAGNAAITSVDDLNSNMKAGGQIATTGSELATVLYEEGRISEAKIYNGLDEAIMDLLNGSIDVLINDLPVTKAYMDARPGTIEIVGETLNFESYGYAVQKGNTELLNKINAGMKKLKENGTYDEIYEKWFK